MVRSVTVRTDLLLALLKELENSGPARLPGAGDGNGTIETELESYARELADATSKTVYLTRIGRQA